MIKIKDSSKIIKKLKKEINSVDFMISNRVSEKDFTRKRKLPFISLILFYINLIKQSLQKELTDFIDLISKSSFVSKSAFCQQRLKLRPEAFIQLNNVLIHEFYTDNVIKKWNEFRLLAIDGSTLELPRSEDIITNFGHNNNIGMIPMAKISTFYDLLNNLIINSHISPCNKSERISAFEHLKKTNKNDLIIFDRAYEGIWLFLYMSINKINHVVRLQRNFLSEFQEFWTNNKNSQIIEITECPEESKKRLKEIDIPFQPFKIRLVKVILDNDEIEVLATSLLDEEKYNYEIFKELYFKRWGIEVNYDHLKNHIEIGNFTGLSSTVIKQDFYANTFIANLQSIIMRDAQIELKKQKKYTKYEYKVNRNLSLGYMKNRIIKILTNNNPNYLKELKQLFKIEPVPIRPNRKFPRKENKHQKKFHINQKSTL